MRPLLRNIALVLSAWILWAHAVGTQPGQSTISSEKWTVKATAETLEACQAQQGVATKKEAEKWRELGMLLTESPTSLSIVVKDIGTMLLSYECWPETMDPRK